MTSKIAISFLLCCSVLVSGCESERNESTKVSNIPRGSINIPSLAIIQDAVLELAPSFNGQRNNVFAGQACALVRGEINVDKLKEILAKEGAGLAGKRSMSDEQLAVLLNANVQAQSSACAAFLATSVLVPVDVTEFMTVVGAVGGEHSSTSKNPSLQINRDMLAQVLPAKFAVAQVNAEVFALIATELQRRPGLSLGKYREISKDLFVKLSRTYLTRLEQYRPIPSTKFELAKMNDEHFTFSSSTGGMFDYSRNGLVLRQRGVIFYGEGLLLGEVYPVEVAYLPDAEKLLSP
ncbi:hypothetical protein [Pseudomonas sp. T8]|uniref:hypothetical protein n=1 Tax=Pseudomonas sp. T8 TaxID=645292 RepID=UPI002147C1E8|nr:hypothetical protein [Pseudomonas sp. T8]UUT23000.1 hypothetical protein NRG23_03315 [Pseudomonas sp. T8]